MHGTQADVFAQWTELLVRVVPPHERSRQKRREEGSKDEGLLDDEHSAHEPDEDEHAPNEADKSNRPRLTL